MDIEFEKLFSLRIITATPPRERPSQPKLRGFATVA
jgi:hypothetical protein